MKPKTLAEAIKNEKLKPLPDAERIELQEKLESLLAEVDHVKGILDEDYRTRLRLQWLKRGWMSRD